MRAESFEGLVAMELRKVVVMARFTLYEMCQTYLCCQRSLLDLQKVARLGMPNVIPVEVYFTKQLIEV